MKYLVYILSLMFALSFIGCEKDKDGDANMKKTETKAMEETPEMMEESTEMMEESTEMMEEKTDEATEMMDEVTD